MEINLKQLGTQAVEASTGTTKMRLSENATSMVFQLFTKNIYSNPIGTVVREITSNCFDSHIEANVKAPVLIKKSFDNQTQTHYISFIDYGVGMSPDRVENIYGVYFESTKRADNTQIGGFGIGGKTPLAYKRPTGHGQGEYDNSFYVITIFDKMKYYYCIFEGEESPVISLLHSEPTTEHNGTEVRIPVLERDLNAFSKEMVRQLYYFENIIFEGFEDQSYSDTLSNKYQIIRTKTFLYRGTEYNNNMHVCLGRVAYPIDYNVLGLNSSDYYLPVALRLEVGDINVVASREQLDYNENTIKVLKKKLEEAKAEIIAMLTKQYDNIVTLNDYFQYQNEFGKLIFPNKTSINVGSLIKKKDIDLTNFKYSFLKIPNDRQLYSFFFETKTLGKNKNTRYNRRNEFDGSYSELISRGDLYYIEDEFKRKVAKASYLNSKHGNYYIISKRNITLNSMRSDIATLFNVHLDTIFDDKGKPVTFIQELLEMQEEFFNIVRENAENYDEIEVPEEFLRRKRHNVLGTELRKIKIPAKLFGSWSNKKRILLDELFKFKGTIFYGVQEDEYALSNAADIFKKLFNSDLLINSYCEYDNEFQYCKKGGVVLIMISKTNVKYMQYCKKAYHIDEIYHRMFYRKADIVYSHFQVNDLLEKFNELSSLYQNTQFSQINKKWGDVINEVSTYINSIPTRNSELNYIKSKLSKYFNIYNVHITDEQKKVLKKIESLYKLQKNNEKILEYINRYSFTTMDDVLIDILKKIMVF